MVYPSYSETGASAHDTVKKSDFYDLKQNVIVDDYSVKKSDDY